MANTLTTPPPPIPDPIAAAAPIEAAPPVPTGAASSAPAQPAPPPKIWGGSQGAIFALQIIYLTILAALAIIYFTDRSLIDLPESLGPISVAVPWFGALGAVLISLVALTQHRNDWDPAYCFWHWSRPLLGASFGSISVLIFEAGILAVGTAPSSVPQNTPKNLLYFLVAFVVGYREETFRELIKRLTDIVFSPGPTPSATGPAISTMSPQSGPAVGGTIVTVLGSGLSKVDSVRFGVTPAKFRVDGDGQITVTSPSGQTGTMVSVSLGAKTVTIGAGTFSYV
jgi:IPT/TIG domain